MMGGQIFIVVSPFRICPPSPLAEGPHAGNESGFARWGYCIEAGKFQTLVTSSE